MSNDDDAEERAYIEGNRAAYASMLSFLAREFYTDEPTTEGKLAALLSERLRAVAALRELCEEFGDNSWPDNMHLADVVEKFLGRQLRARETP